MLLFLDLTGLLNAAATKEPDCLTPPSSDKGSVGSPSDVDSDSNPPSPICQEEVYVSGKLEQPLSTLTMLVNRSLGDQ